jgi:hypothetical protein
VDREREGIPEKKEGRPSPLKREDPDARVKDAPIAPGSIKKIPKYRKGDIVEVTKVPDPNERRGAAYFRADDGLGGLVVLGTPPSVEIGQKTQLQINGVMEKEGLYNFAAIGAKKEPTHKPRDGRRRR